MRQTTCLAQRNEVRLTSVAYAWMRLYAGGRATVGDIFLPLCTPACEQSLFKLSSQVPLKQLSDNVFEHLMYYEVPITALLS